MAGPSSLGDFCVTIPRRMLNNDDCPWPGAGDPAADIGEAVPPASRYNCSSRIAISRSVRLRLSLQTYGRSLTRSRFPSVTWGVRQHLDLRRVVLSGGLPEKVTGVGHDALVGQAYTGIIGRNGDHRKESRQGPFGRWPWLVSSRCCPRLAARPQTARIRFGFLMSMSSIWSWVTPASRSWGTISVRTYA